MNFNSRDFQIAEKIRRVIFPFIFILLLAILTYGICYWFVFFALAELGLSHSLFILVMVTLLTIPTTLLGIFPIGKQLTKRNKKSNKGQPKLAAFFLAWICIFLSSILINDFSTSTVSVKVPSEIKNRATSTYYRIKNKYLYTNVDKESYYIYKSGRRIKSTHVVLIYVVPLLDNEAQVSEADTIFHWIALVQDKSIGGAFMSSETRNRKIETCLDSMQKVVDNYDFYKVPYYKSLTYHADQHVEDLINSIEKFDDDEFENPSIRTPVILEPFYNNRKTKMLGFIIIAAGLIAIITGVFVFFFCDLKASS